jgi:hypothetical protein
MSPASLEALLQLIEREQLAWLSTVSLDSTIQFIKVALWNWHRRRIRSDVAPNLFCQQDLLWLTEIAEARDVSGPH